MWPMKMASESVRQIASSLAEAKRRQSVQKHCVPSLSSTAPEIMCNFYLIVFRRSTTLKQFCFSTEYCCPICFPALVSLTSSGSLWATAGLTNQGAALWLKYFGSKFWTGNVSRTGSGFLAVTFRVCGECCGRILYVFMKAAQSL